jgi:hypothetical protein
MNITERFDRLDEFIAGNRLVRKSWGDGEDRACLLLALAPEIGTEGVRDRCPASVLPPWFARITPSMDDCGTKDAWPTMIRRYSRVVRRGATTLDDAGWRRVLARTMIAILEEAATFDPSGPCVRVSVLWSSVLTGEEPLKEEWVEARSAAVAAAGFPGTAVSTAWARSAARAARGAGGAAGAAAAAAAWAAANAKQEERADTWDRMTTAILDGIEIECGAHCDRRKETE